MDKTPDTMAQIEAALDSFHTAATAWWMNAISHKEFTEKREFLLALIRSALSPQPPAPAATSGREEFDKALADFADSLYTFHYTDPTDDEKIDKVLEAVAAKKAEVLRLYDALAAQPGQGEPIGPQPGPERFEIDLSDYFFVECKQVEDRLMIDLQRKTTKPPTPTPDEAGVPKVDGYFPQDDCPVCGSECVESLTGGAQFTCSHCEATWWSDFRRSTAKDQSDEAWVRAKFEAQHADCVFLTDADRRLCERFWIAGYRAALLGETK